jgi:2-dehydropantoate 2-reductase
MSPPQARFAVLGAGALGSILGSHLAHAGHRVVMLARERRAAQIARAGLRISGLSELAVPVAVCAPGELEAADVLIVAMKTPGTAAALEALRGARIGLAFSIQNGLQKNETLSAAFGAARVLGALADTSGEMLEDGSVRFTRNVAVYLGELDGGLTARVRELAATIDAAGVRAEAATDILDLEWSKFCAWVGLMVLAVTTRALTAQFLSDARSALALARLVRETGRLAEGCGAQLTDRTVLPVASICRDEEDAAVALLLERGRVFAATAPAHRVSSLQDLLAGRPLEVEETLGFACAQARALGLRLPLLELFYPLIAAIDGQSRAVK